MTKRKPLVIRGARQVGKSYLVRELAKENGLDLVELNFERDPRAAKLFTDNDVSRTVRAIEGFTGRPVGPRSLLFLDEIQAAPEILAKLRWLHEGRPRLPVIAAGSLLDFALADHAFSMPVGRISYLYLEPMSFAEFLVGIGDTELGGMLGELDLRHPPTSAIHERLLERFRDYVLVGGMPEAVETFRESQSLLECARVHSDLLATIRDDFAKYAAAVHRDRLVTVLDAVPRMVGQKFVYTRVDRDQRAAALRQAANLLCDARVCHRVRATHATGIPLGAEVDERRFKLLLLDVGLLSASLRLGLSDLPRADEVILTNEGAVAEQAVGQALRTARQFFEDPELYYWFRDAHGAEAEVDYLVQHGRAIVPIEVKAGTTGTLRSLHTLMAARRWKRAVRFNADVPSITNVDTPTKSGDVARYTLLSLPLYAAHRIHALIDSMA